MIADPRVLAHLELNARVLPLTGDAHRQVIAWLRQVADGIEDGELPAWRGSFDLIARPETAMQARSR